MLRTREIISDLSYDKLLSKDIIPDMITPMTEYFPDCMSIKKYPPFIYSNKSKMNFSFFGYFMEYVIRAGLRIKLRQKIESGIEPITDKIFSLPDIEMMNIIESISIYESCTNMNDVISAAYHIVSILYNESVLDLTDINKYIPTMINIIKELIVKWTKFKDYLEGTLRYNEEYSNDHFSGHPDLVTDLCVIDVKNTASFKKMSKESCLQVLAYYALIKETNDNIQYGGFILPMQRELVLIKLANWNHEPFLKLLTQTAIAKKPAKNKLYYNPFAIYNIGNHISKGKNIAETLKDYAVNSRNKSVQMFLRNTHNGKCSSNTYDQIIEASQVIMDNELLYFTHAPYAINLCTNQHDGDNYWAQKYLNEDLLMTSALGGRGVVVHTGARKDLPLEEALNTMEYMVREALQYATEKSVLMLETPVSEGSEIVTTLKELGDFFMRFNDEERLKLGICIDSAHVWGAGYDPLTYIKQWVEKYPSIKIGLVHFNDSKAKCGSGLDRHQDPGFGFIGLEKMLAIAEFCYKSNIPMLHE